MSAGNIGLVEFFFRLRESRRSFYPLIAIMAALFLLTMVFWTIWQAFGASIPCVFSISRFWLDSFALPFCFPYFLLAMGYFVVNFNDVVDDEETSKILKIAFAAGIPLVLSVILTMSIIYSFLIGLAIFLALTVLALLGKLVYFFLCRASSFLDRVFGAGEGEEDIFS